MTGAIELIGTNGLRYWAARERIIREDLLPIGKTDNPPNKKSEISYDKRGKKKKNIPNRLDIKG